jgi:hypothetical protein
VSSISFGSSNSNIYDCDVSVAGRSQSSLLRLVVSDFALDGADVADGSLVELLELRLGFA